MIVVIRMIKRELNKYLYQSGQDTNAEEIESVESSC